MITKVTYDTSQSVKKVIFELTHNIASHDTHETLLGLFPTLEDDCCACMLSTLHRVDRTVTLQNTMQERHCQRKQHEEGGND
jgi:hypothetical protein